jgi:hypothetical protein
VHQGKSRYCLKETNKFMLPREASRDIPFVEFIDVDRDGMVDMVFFHDGQIYVYYNMHTAKKLETQMENLCKS